VVPQTITIRIRDGKGAALQLPLCYRYNLGLFRESISSIFHIPLHTIVLYVNGTVYPDHTRIERFGDKWVTSCSFEVRFDDSQKAPQLKRNSEGSFQIFVKMIDGKTQTLDIHDTDTVLELMTQIQAVSGILPTSQRLLFAGKQLEETLTLKDYGLSSGSTLHLVLRLI